MSGKAGRFVAGAEPPAAGIEPGRPSELVAVPRAVRPAVTPTPSGLAVRLGVLMGHAAVEAGAELPSVKARSGCCLRRRPESSWALVVAPPAMPTWVAATARRRVP